MSDRRREILVARNQTHGLSRLHKQTYQCWKDMRQRCNNPNNTDYKNYGARGIVVCSRWDDFSAFFADMGPRPDGMTLDRINTNGPYYPENCRWATPETQANNKRTNNRITINGETKTLEQWARASGLGNSRVRYRLRVGYSPVEALTLEDMRVGNSQN